MNDLIRRCQQGEAKAWEELFAGFRDRALRMARQLAGSKAEVEDLVQEACLRAVNSIHAFRGDASFATWFFGILRRLYFDQLRRQRPATISLEDCRESLCSTEGDPERKILQTEACALIFRCLKRLPAPDRLTLYMKDFLHYSYEEIAEMLQISVEAVRSRLYRTRRLLRKEYAGLMTPG